MLKWYIKLFHTFREILTRSALIARSGPQFAILPRIVSGAVILMQRGFTGGKSLNIFNDRSLRREVKAPEVLFSHVASLLYEWNWATFLLYLISVSVIIVFAPDRKPLPIHPARSPRPYILMILSVLLEFSYRLKMFMVIKVSAVAFLFAILYLCRRWILERFTTVALEPSIYWPPQKKPSFEIIFTLFILLTMSVIPSACIVVWLVCTFINIIPYYAFLIYFWPAAFMVTISTYFHLILADGTFLGSLFRIASFASFDEQPRDFGLPLLTYDDVNRQLHYVFIFTMILAAPVTALYAITKWYVKIIKELLQYGNAVDFHSFAAFLNVVTVGGYLSVVPFYGFLADLLTSYLVHLWSVLLPNARPADFLSASDRNRPSAWSSESLRVHSKCSMAQAALKAGGFIDPLELVDLRGANGRLYDSKGVFNDNFIIMLIKNPSGATLNEQIAWHQQNMLTLNTFAERARYARFVALFLDDALGLNQHYQAWVAYKDLGLLSRSDRPELLLRELKWAEMLKNQFSVDPRAYYLFLLEVIGDWESKNLGPNDPAVPLVTSHDGARPLASILDSRAYAFDSGGLRRQVLIDQGKARPYWADISGRCPHEPALSEKLKYFSSLFVERSAGWLFGCLAAGFLALLIFFFFGGGPEAAEGFSGAVSQDNSQDECKQS